MTRPSTKIQKVREHPTQNEALLFESSSPGKSGYQLPVSMSPRWTRAMCWAPPIRGPISKVFPR